MKEVLEWLSEPRHWEVLVIVVPAALTALWGVAELTPWEWDNRAIQVARKLWGLVPVGERDPREMGRRA